ncbi:MAG: hypothetical protein JWM27_2140 [Gemmatimonadetes bacterium]|nr:hypothetical protein [Gemmatimonadota bacterium]
MNNPNLNFVFAAFWIAFALVMVTRSELALHPAQVITVFACGAIAGASLARGLQLRRAAA